jgi:methionine salvage enolase-phosphatase E1
MRRTGMISWRTTRSAQTMVFVEVVEAVLVEAEAVVFVVLAVAEVAEVAEVGAEVEAVVREEDPPS